MVTFNLLCLELFLLAQKGIGDVAGSARGRMWEEAVAEQLALRGIPVESVPGGYRVFGLSSVSGLRHQVDATLACTDAVVLAEWKAYNGPFPKNEILRFKAATDDYYMSFGTVGLNRPEFRLFGGLGSASDDLRRYAALHGIAIIERDRWPLPVLAANELIWPNGPAAGPSLHDRMALAWGVRPLGRIMCPQPSGEFLVPRPESAARIESCLRLHEYWSDELWDVMDLELGAPEEILFKLWTGPRAA